MVGKSVKSHYPDIDSRGCDSPISEIDNHLLERIHAGDGDTWHDFVLTYNNRLLAFATRQVDQCVTAEDIVQETFVSFLQSLGSYRRDCEIETFLFQILRRRIVDHYRAMGRRIDVRACECLNSFGEITGTYNTTPVNITDPSIDCERREDNTLDELALSQAIRVVCGRLRSRSKFRDLKIADGALYASLPNPQIAVFLGCSPSEIAVVKHRLVGKLADTVQELRRVTDDNYVRPLSESMLVGVWERLRPSCPKRTTLGKYLLNLLPPDWHHYVEFHARQLGCRFCAANLEELDAKRVDNPSIATRLINSTIGFLQDNRTEAS